MSLISSEKMVCVQLAALQFLQKLAESRLGAEEGDCARGGSETRARGGGGGGVCATGACGGVGTD